MSRFSGWTSAALEKRNNPNPQQITKSKKKSTHRDYEGELSSALDMLGLKPERNYKFLPDMRYRFDFAFPALKVAIEFEGAIHSRGRHVRGIGYANDCKKYTLAAMHRWQLWRYTTEDIKGPMGVMQLAARIKLQIEQIQNPNKN